MLKQETVLVFDYDGVLADTEALHWRSWAALMQRYNLDLTWQDYCQLWKGVDDTRVCEDILNQVPSLERHVLVREVLERKQTVLNWSLANCPIPQETIRLFMTLGGYRLGLVTSSERWEVEPILRLATLHDRFDGMVFGGEVVPKPASDPYLLLARKLGVKTGVAFEDSASGIQSALAAGFTVVRVEQAKDLAKSVSEFLERANTT